MFYLLGWTLPMTSHINSFVFPIVAVPMVLWVLARFKFISSGFLVRSKRYAIFASFAIAAVFTPPDVFSQAVTALALIGLYEISIWFVLAAN